YISLVKEFERQIAAGNFQYLIEIQSDGTGKEMSIGEKRHKMYLNSKSAYTLQWDSDDWISENGIELIMQALKEEPDCVTFEEYVNINGKEFKGNHSLKYTDWQGDGK